MPEIPTTEPTTIVKGDTVSWYRSLADYPATDWTLHYSLSPVKGGTPYAITALDDAEDPQRFVVSLSSGVTATMMRGLYRLRAWVEDGTHRFTLPALSVEVNILADPAAETAEDERSHAHRMVDQLETAYQQLVTRTVTTSTVNGSTYTLRSLDELTRALKYWRQQADAEDRSGMAGSGRILVRF